MSCPVRLWWRQDFDYAWFPAFLRRRALIGPVRFLNAVACLTLAACGILLQMSEAGPSNPIGRIVTLAASVTAILAAFRWAPRSGSWPTETRSLLFVAWADGGLAAVLVFGLSDPVAALSGCSMFVLIGLYVVLVHRPAVVAAHLVWSLSVTGGLAAYLLTVGNADLPMTFVRVLAQATIAVMTSICLAVTLWFLREDAQGSHYDPLTDLLNRRGLESAALPWFDRLADTDAVVGMVLDLDEFKPLNDTHGHTAGDLALLATARRLQVAAPDKCLVGRLGGDEFVAVFSARQADVGMIASAIHAAVHDPGDDRPVTASAGVGIVTNRDQFSDDTEALDELLRRADVAMYEAKRRGGNTLNTSFGDGGRASTPAVG